MHNVAVYLLLQASLGSGLHESAFVQAIHQAHHLRVHFTAILKTVESTFRSFCSETKTSLSISPWAGVLIFLLKVIRSAARGDRGVRTVILNAKEEFTNTIAHIRRVGSNSERYPELDRYCMYFEKCINFPVLFYNQESGQYQGSIPHPSWTL